MFCAPGHFTYAHWSYACYFSTDTSYFYWALISSCCRCTGTPRFTWWMANIKRSCIFGIYPLDSFSICRWSPQLFRSLSILPPRAEYPVTSFELTIRATALVGIFGNLCYTLSYTKVGSTHRLFHTSSYDWKSLFLTHEMQSISVFSRIFTVVIASCILGPIT